MAEIVVEDKRSVALAVHPLPEQGNALMSLVERFASNDNIDVAKAEKLIELFISGQRKIQEIQDEREYYARMAEFKENPPDIVKERIAKIRGESKNGQAIEFTYNFADLDAYASAAMPALAEKGITWDFPTMDTGQLLTVSCRLHFGLFSVTPCTLSGPPDTSGTKNALQAKSSTLSYLERYTFCAATGLTAGMPDTDGHIRQGLTDDVRKKHVTAIQSSPDHDALKLAFQVAVKVAGQDKDSVNAFAAAKNIRYKEIANAKAN